MCLTLLQELKGRLYFEDYSYSNCVDSIILLNFAYLVCFFSIYKQNRFSYDVDVGFEAPNLNILMSKVQTSDISEIASTLVQLKPFERKSCYFPLSISLNIRFGCTWFF